jgi:hypothetical protein
MAKGFAFSTIKDSIAIDSTSTIDIQTFEPNFKDKYKGDQYNYESLEGDTQNILSNVINGFFEFLESTFGFEISPVMMEIFKIGIYVIMGGLVLFLLIRFVIGENFNTVFTKAPKTYADINLQESHIEEIDLDSLIAEALQNKDYRLAFRYQFLNILKVLSTQDKIKWSYHKTNKDYSKEIKDSQVQQAFSKASYAYDYIWYGEFDIDETKYQKANLNINSLKKMLENVR